MLVYLTGKNKELPNSQTYHDIFPFSRSVEDAECREIVCEDFFCNYHVSELKEVLAMVLSKLRTNGTLTISEKDLNIISRQVYRESLDLVKLNELFFSEKYSAKSMLSLEIFESMIPEGFVVTEKEYGTIHFKIKLRRA